MIDTASAVNEKFIPLKDISKYFREMRKKTIIEIIIVSFIYFKILIINLEDLNAFE